MITSELKRSTNIIYIALILIVTGCFGNRAAAQSSAGGQGSVPAQGAGQSQVSASAQPAHSNPWAPTELGLLPPIAPLSEGVWLKGELHVHSRHSIESSNNPVAKIISFSRSVGMDYVCIT